MRRWGLRAVLVLLILIGGASAVGIAWGDGSSPLPQPFALQPSGSGQDLPLAYLDPGIFLDIDVGSGRLVLSGTQLEYRRMPTQSYGPSALANSDTDVVAIHAPGRAGLQRYTGGIPGLGSGSPTAALPLGDAPAWGPPREQLRAGRLVGLVFPDGQRVAVTLDARQRVTALRWRGPGGVRLRVRVRYRPGERAITDPFGVTRTYRLVPHGVVEVVPRSWRGRGYHPPVSRVLDSFRSFLAVQDREPDDLPDRLSRFGGQAFDVGPNGGLLLASITALREAPPLIRLLKAAGMLDVSAIVPQYETDGRVDRLADRVFAHLGGVARRCHLAVYVEDDFIQVVVSTALSAADGRAVEAELRHVDGLVVLTQQGRSECATPLSRTH